MYALQGLYEIITYLNVLPSCALGRSPCEEQLFGCEQENNLVLDVWGIIGRLLLAWGFTRLGANCN